MPPLVVLDHTLADLFYAAGVRQPLIAKTVYPQDEDPDVYGSTEEEKVRFRRSELAFWPLKGAFPLGNMEVILFANATAKPDAKKDWGQLCPTRQPKARFPDLEKGTPEVLKALQSLVFGKSLVFSYPCGWMQEARCIVDPDTANKLESKRFLFESGIRTPQLGMPSLEDPGYNSVLAEKDLPFVVKYPLAASSYGTWLVTSEKVRLQMMAAVQRFETRGGTEVHVCLLSNFFWKKRGLKFAQTGSFEFTGRPELIYDALSALIERGEIIVTASVALDDSNGTSIAWLVWGSSTQDSLAGLRGHVRRLLDSLSCGGGLVSNL